MKNKIMFLSTLVIQMLFMSVPVSGQQTPGLKKATSKKHTLLIVLCHADDFISIAPLIPKYAAEGHADYYLALTGGIDSTEMAPGGTKFTQMQCAAKALGFLEATAFVDTTTQLQRVSGQLRSVALNARHIIDAIERIKPDVLITWGPDGLTGNIRHVLVSNIVTRVFQQQSLYCLSPQMLSMLNRYQHC